MARYLQPPYSHREESARRLLARADEIDAGIGTLRLCVTRCQDGSLTTWHESRGTVLPQGRWVDIDGEGRMTPVPAEWVQWHKDRIDALRRASRTEGSEGAAKASAEWDGMEPR
jgi:hypothetical protein